MKKLLASMLLAFLLQGCFIDTWFDDGDNDDERQTKTEPVRYLK